METQMVVVLALGISVGLILGLTGAGGAVIGVPFLVFGLDLPVAEASPIALLAVVIAASIGAVMGLRDRQLRYKAALIMSGCGTLISPLGLWLAQQVPNNPLLIMFAAVLMYVSVKMFLQARQELNGCNTNSRQSPPCLLDETRGKLTWTLPCFRAMLSAGSAAGFLSGLLGVGGGFVIVPALKNTTNLSTHSIVATSLGVVTLISFAGVIGSSLANTMNWNIAGPFATATLFGMVFGKSVSKKISGPKLQQFFCIIALLVSFGMLYRAIY